jgi:hypothetical protein
MGNLDWDQIDRRILQAIGESYKGSHGTAYTWREQGFVYEK